MNILIPASYTQHLAIVAHVNKHQQHTSPCFESATSQISLKAANAFSWTLSTLGTLRLNRRTLWKLLLHTRMHLTEVSLMLNDVNIQPTGTRRCKTLSCVCRNKLLQYYIYIWGMNSLLAIWAFFYWPSNSIHYDLVVDVFFSPLFFFFFFGFW